jgi:hypothetical protein
VRSGSLEEAARIIAIHRAGDDPHWLQISAGCRYASGDESGALDDLLGASRLIPRPEVLLDTGRLALKLRRHDVADEVLHRLVTITQTSNSGFWR